MINLILRNNIYLLILIVLLIASCNGQESRLLGTDFKLFKNTPIWLLAKAVSKQDTSQFEKLLVSSQVNLDFDENIYGLSLLQVAVLNNLDRSVYKLLELGADPNHTDKNEGESAMHDAVGVFQNNDDTLILSLLLKHDGNPNAKTVLTVENVGVYSKNVLSVLCSNVNDQPNKLKLLIESGASLEIDTTDNANYLNSAITSQNYKLVWLLLNSGADYSKPIFTNISGDRRSIEYCMKMQLIDLESEEYKYKLKVIDF